MKNIYVGNFRVFLHCKRSSAEGRSSTANSGTKVAVLPGMNRCGSFPLLSAPRSLFSIWTDLKTSEKIPGAPTWRWWEWIWLTGPSGLHRNSPQGLNISSIRVFDQIRDPEIQITLRLRGFDWLTDLRLYYLFNDGHVLYFRSETVAVRRRMNIVSDDYGDQMMPEEECSPNFLTFVLQLRKNP